MSGAIPVEETKQGWLDWAIRPGFFNQKTQEYTSKGANIQDILDAASTGFDWVPYFSSNKSTLTFAETASSTFGTMAKGLALPALFSSLNETRRKWDKMGASDGSESTTEFIKSGLVTTLNTGNTIKFFDAANIVKCASDTLKAVNCVFWTAAGILDSISLYQELGSLEQVTEEIEKETIPEVKSYKEQVKGLSYLKIAHHANTIALASLILVSIVFSSLSKMLIFSPVVTLGLSTLWFVLLFINYYYEEINKATHADLVDAKLI